MVEQAQSEPRELLQAKSQQAVTGDRNMIVAEVGGGSVVTRDIFAESVVIGSRPHKANVPRQAPILPLHFVNRPEHYQAVKALLLSEAPNIPGTLVVSAIYGLGGIGKSTLAAAVAHASEVEATFRDGTLWAVLGQQPDILSFLNNWIRELGDDYEPTTIEAASKRLRTLVHDKKVLLVVDDVWNPSHVEPFRVGAVGCRLLVTTREASVPVAIRYDLNVMKPEESLALLTQKVLTESQQDNQLTEAERDQALALAEAVGYLPLALVLAAAQVANGVAWADLLAALRAEVARLETFDILGEEGSSEEARKNRSLTASFNLSLRSLSQEQLQQFAWFGILPEDVTITSEMAATLWGVSAQDAGAILRSLRSKALLTQSAQVLNYQLHDLLHDLAGNLLTAPSETSNQGRLPGFGLSLPEAHAVFLNHYRSHLQNNLWHTLPDDGYIHAHLIWHLEKAGWVDEIHQLLREENGTGQNGWYAVRQQLRQLAGYAADIQRAWTLAEALFVHQAGRSIGLQCRYALITASLNSLIGSVPPALMVALVEKSIWNLADGLAYIEQTRNPSEQAEALKELIPRLTAPLEEILLQRILAMVRGVQDEGDRACLLIQIAVCLPQPMQEPMMQEAIALTRALKGLWLSQALDLVETLRKLKLPLPESLLREMWAVSVSASQQQATPQNVKKLASLLSLLSESLLEEALQTTQYFEDKEAKAGVQYFLAPYLPKVQKQQVLGELLSFAKDVSSTKKNDLSRFLILIAQQFSELFEGHILQAALKLVRRIRDKNRQAIALAALSAHLSEVVKRKLVFQIYKLSSTPKKKWYVINLVSALLNLGSNLSDPQMLRLLRQMLKRHVSTGSEADQLKVLKFLAPHLTELEEEQLKQKALTVAQNIEGAADQAKALIALLPKLPEPMKGQALQEALKATKAIEAVGDRAEQLTALIPYALKSLKEEIVRDVLAAAEATDEGRRAEILSELAPHLPETLRQEALKVAQAIRDEIDRVWVLNELELHVSEATPQAPLNSLNAERRSERNENRNTENGSYEDWQDKREKLCRIEDEITRLKALEVHESYRPLPEQRQQVAWPLQSHRLWWKRLLAAALRGIRAVLVRPVRLLARVLVKILVQLTAWVPQRLKRLLMAILIKPFTMLTSRLRKQAKQTLSWDPVFDAASGIEDEAKRTDAFDALAPISWKTQRRRTAKWKTAAGSVENKIAQITALGTLASHLSESVHEVMWEALNIALSIEDNLVTFDALMILMPYTTGAVREALLREVVLIALATEDGVARRTILKTLAPYQAQFIQKKLLQEALPIVRKIEDQSVRTAAPRVLAPYFPESLQQEVLKADQGEKQTIQVKALVALVPHLSSPMREKLAWKAFQMARALEDKTTRIKSLIALAPHLSWALKSKVLDEILNSTPATVSEKQKAAEVLMALAPHCWLRKQSLRNGCRVSSALIRGNVQVWMLRRLLPLLPDSLSWKVLQKVLLLLRPVDKKPLLKKMPPALLSKLILVASKVQHLIQAVVQGRIGALVLTAMVPHVKGALRERVLQKALSSLQAIKRSHTRSEILVTLAHYLTESSQQEVLKAARKPMIKDGVVCLDALTILVPHLPQALQQELVRILQDIKDGSISSEVLAILTQYLPEPLQEQAIQGACSGLQTIADEKHRAAALNRVVPHLPASLTKQLLQEALTALRTIKDIHTRSEVLQILSPHLLKAQLEEALAIAQSIGDENVQAEALAKLTSSLPHDQKEQLSSQVLAIIKKVKNKSIQAKTLIAVGASLAESLQEQVPQELLRLIQEIEDDTEQAEILELIVSHLPDPLVIEIISDVDSTKNIDARARKISILAPYIKSKPLKLKVLKSLLKDIPKIENEGVRAEALCALASNLPELILQEVLALAAQQIDDDKLLKEVLGEILERLPAQIQYEARIVIRTVENESERLEALNRLSQYFSDLFLHKTDKSIWEVENAPDRNIFLTTLNYRLENLLAYSPLLSTPIYVLAKILSFNSQKLTASEIVNAFEIFNEIVGWRIRKIIEFFLSIKYEIELLKKGVIEVVETIKGDKNRAKVLTALLPCLKDSEKDYFLWEAQRAARSIENSLEQVKAIVALLPYSDEVTSILPVNMGFTTTQNMKNRLNLIKAISVLAPEFIEDLNLSMDPEKDDFLGEALTALKNIGNTADRAKAQAILFPYLPESVRDKVFGIGNPLLTSLSGLAEVLEPLSPYLLERASSGILKMSDQSRNKSQGAKVLTLNWKNLEKDSESEVLLERFTVDKAINLALKELLKKVQSDDNKALVFCQEFFDGLKTLKKHTFTSSQF